MPGMARLLISLFFMVLCAGVTAAEPVQSPHAKVELLAERSEVTAGEELMLGIRFELDPEWHVYWKNPGDSGAAPRFQFSPSASFEIGEILWPAPNRIRVGPLLNYGYEHEVLLLAPLKVSSRAQPGDSIELSAPGEWLVCKEDCIPGEGTLKLQLPVVEKALAASNPLFVRAKEMLPRPTTAQLHGQFEADTLKIRVQALENFSPAAFIPDKPGIIENAPAQIVQATASGNYEINIQRAAIKNAPQAIQGLLLEEDREGRVTKALHANVETTPDASGDAPGRATLLFALFGALLGGLILNLMPCVLPVLGIKVVSLLEQHAAEPRHARLHALSYAGGILISMWVLCGFAVVLHQIGAASGWGFQLQEPWFVSLLALFFTLIGLNLLGYAEIGHAIQSRAGALKVSSDYQGSFATGVLTTSVATPCTAPFMGASVAFALSAGPLVAFVIFSALALGLALPFLTIAFIPGARRLLPRPGDWMNSFKQFLAFPMFASSVWLLAVLGLQAGSEAVIQCLCAMLLAAFGIWLLHLKPVSRNRKIVVGVLCVAAFVSSIVAAVRVEPIQTSKTDPEVDQYGLSWEPWSDAALAGHQAAGRTVFLDFTAAWCITCQVNKRVVFGSEEVRQRLRHESVILMRADWTSKDPRIAQALQRYGRAGVPLNILFRPGKAAHIFPSLMTRQMVIEALSER